MSCPRTKNYDLFPGLDCGSLVFNTRKYDKTKQQRRSMVSAQNGGGGGVCPKMTSHTEEEGSHICDDL